MKFFTKTISLILALIAFSLTSELAFGKETRLKYTKGDISNYFYGIVSANQDYTTRGFKHLNKVQKLKNSHSNFNVQFIRSLVLVEKFDQAFDFAKSIWREEELFFEADLLLGLEAFIKKDYSIANKYFERLNRISKHNLIFNDFFGNILISWTKASENKKKDSFEFLDKIPERYDNLKQIQNSFLQCYFDTSKTEITFEKLIGSEESGFLRYNFFLANYLISKNKKLAAKLLIENSRDTYNSNLLLKQTENFIINDKYKKISSFFNCQNPKDNIAEIFYVMANLYATEKNYKASNFYLNISTFLNKKFIPNKTLLAENLFYQKKYKLSEEMYNKIESIGPIYSWYAAKNIAIILSDTAGIEEASKSLTKKFNLLKNVNFENYYEMANFFKNNDYYEESIKYYSLALENIKEDHFLFSKVLERRGTSYERLGNWDEAEKDLLESLRISPDEPHVLNYLAYSWIEQEINVSQSIQMLKKANELKEDDGYIIDSLGWAYFVNENYVDAENLLQKAVEILPLDPIINDHYADALWMLDRYVQARYFWKHVLSLKEVEPKLKDSVSKKLIFGIEKKL